MRAFGRLWSAPNQAQYALIQLRLGSKLPSLRTLLPHGRRGGKPYFCAATQSRIFVSSTVIGSAPVFNTWS